MEQPNSTPYGSSITYPNMMELPDSLPYRTALKGPTALDPGQQSFDAISYFHTVAQEILDFPVVRATESSLDPWLMDMPASASPKLSKTSMSPSQDIATPSSDGFYSPPYPEQLQLPAYYYLEQSQSLRTSSTSHPTTVNNGENWEHNYAESELWATQPFVAQPWVPTPYDGYTSPNMAIDHAHSSDSSLTSYTYAIQSHLPATEVVQIMGAAGNGSPPSDSDFKVEEDSSDEESDSDGESSIYSQFVSSASRTKTNTRSSRPHIEKWTVAVNNIQHSVIRCHVCNFPGCTSSFGRPEHLRRHFKSKHLAAKDFKCVVPNCKAPYFSRGDNLGDHYWTHLNRGGRTGKNEKFTLQELKEILGPKEKRVIKRLREKQRKHHEKEKLKRQRAARPAYMERSML